LVAKKLYTVVPGLPGGERYVIVQPLVLSQYRRVSDRLTGRQTDRRQTDTPPSSKTVSATIRSCRPNKRPWDYDGRGSTLSARLSNKNRLAGRCSFVHAGEEWCRHWSVFAARC